MKKKNRKTEEIDLECKMDLAIYLLLIFLEKVQFCIILYFGFSVPIFPRPCSAVSSDH